MKPILCIAVAILTIAAAPTPPPAPAAGPTPLAPPAATQPPDDAWAAALAHVQRATYRYRGRVTGYEGPGEIVIGLDAARGGKLSGYAVLLRRDGSLEGSGPVSGTAEGRHCEMEIAMEAIALSLKGACRPDVLSGTLAARHVGFDLLRWVYSQGAQDDLGAFWLTATQ